MEGSNLTKFCIDKGEKGINEFWSDVALVGLVLSSIIGIIVNGVTLYIISKRIGLRQQSIFSSIFCLAFFDLLLCAFVLPVQAHRFNLREWPFGDNCTMQYIQVILVGLVTFTIGKIPYHFSVSTTNCENYFSQPWLASILQSIKLIRYLLI